MKLLIVTSFYSGYLEQFYARRPELAQRTYAEQKDALEADCFGWAACWRSALPPLGCEVFDIVHNAEMLQRSWGREHGVPDWESVPLKRLALLQAKSMAPDLLWFDDYDADFLKTLREAVPSIRGVLGWVGSALPPTDVWRHLDLILSCAPESVATLRAGGFPALEFPHSFDPRVLERLQVRPKRVEVSFFGQLVRSSQFHLERDRLLEELAREVPLEIFSSSAFFGWRDEAKALVKVGLCGASRVLTALGCSEKRLRSLPGFQVVAGLSPADCRPVNPRLKRLLRPPVYGVDMFQLVADSVVTLNIHADSSPRFASNMRLYEGTGAGSCLVTDWKENLSELFEPDREVVSYRSGEECREKVRWLLEHREAALEIARAGQRRTLDCYTFAKRAPHLLEVLAGVLSGGGSGAAGTSSTGGNHAR